MQHDFDLANQSGLLFRQDANNALQSLATLSSGTAAPTTTYAFQWWVDTSGGNPILKYRNAANSAWISVGRMDLESFGLQGIIASATAPSSPLAFSYWVDTSGANPILRIRNQANTAWLAIGRVDIANYGLLPLTGGVMSGPITYSSTDSTSIPVGTTAQRPGSPTTGMIRFNTDLITAEGYNGTAWAPIGGGGFTVTAVQSVTAAGTINSSTTDQRQMRLVQGNAAAVSASTTPFGTGGAWKDGTEIMLVGNDDTNSVTLTYNDAANGLVGNFSTIEITRFKTVGCLWSSALSRWIVKGIS